MKKLFLFLTLGIISNYTFSQWTDNPSANTLINDTVKQQIIPLIATSESNGASFISWQTNSGAYHYQLFLNNIDDAGELQWGREGIMLSDEPTYEWVTHYGLISDDDNNAVLINHDLRQGYSNAVAYRVSPNGDLLWGQNGLLLTDNTNDCVSLSLLQDYNSNYIFAWQEDSLFYDTTGNGMYKSTVNFTKVDKEMNFLWDLPREITNDTISFFKERYNMVLREDNSFYMVYMGTTNPWDSVSIGQITFSNIYVMLFDENGMPLWENQVALEQNNFLPDNFHITGQAFLRADGGIAVTWRAAGYGVLPSVKVQFLDEEGNKFLGLYGETVILDDKEIIVADFSAEYISELDDIFVYWSNIVFDPAILNYRNSIVGQRIDNDGNRLWGNYGRQFHSETIDSTYVVWDIATHPDGSMATLYSQNYNLYEPDTMSIELLKAFRNNVNGEMLWENDEHIIISDAISSKASANMGNYYNGQWVATWSDSRSYLGLSMNNSSIYAQNINEDGTIGPVGIFNPGVGIGDKISIYPNPTTKDLVVVFNLNDIVKSYINIYDLHGRMVKHVDAGYSKEGENRATINTSTLTAGTYMLTVVTDVTNFSQKLVIVD